jgi:antitoxin component of RelBE/YafQ-DinJ toxin-antitoxin module
MGCCGVKKNVIQENRIPFLIEGSHEPNAETIAAMKGGERLKRDTTAR